MRAQDWLVASFPQAAACPETLPGGDIEVPLEHPIVRQTITDCLTEAMDVEGFLEVLRGLRDGTIERRAVDTAEPSPFAQGILNAAPYAFLDDAPLEERRTQAVISRRTLDVKSADELGALDPEAIARVREEAWPRPESAEEVHEALLWMGYVTSEEGRPWQAWLEELAGARRASSGRATAGSRRRRPATRRRAAGAPGGARADRLRRAGESCRAGEAGSRAARAHRGARRAGVTGGCSRGSIATRWTGSARRSSR